jgi:hypothetical protein
MRGALALRLAPRHSPNRCPQLDIVVDGTAHWSFTDPSSFSVRASVRSILFHAFMLQGSDLVRLCGSTRWRRVRAVSGRNPSKATLSLLQLDSIQNTLYCSDVVFVAHGWVSTPSDLCATCFTYAAPD